MKYDTLSLVITDKCNAECDFCGFSCSPRNNNVMDGEMMKRVIREAGALGIKKIGFSGGEPLLYPELLSEGISEAREQEMSVNIATNGYWGSWEKEKIQKVLEKLKPDFVGFSYDSMHKKYIPEEVFFNAVTAVVHMYIPFVISVSDMKGEYSAGKFLAQLGLNKFMKSYIIYPAYRCGRALNIQEEKFITQNARDARLGCLSDRIVSVLYNGDVYPCCKYEVLDTAMKIGNLSDGSLKELLDSSDVPEICDVLMQDNRFRRLLDAVRSNGTEIPEEFGCPCDYCRMMFRTQEQKMLLKPLVEELYGEMMVRSVLKGGARDDTQ